MTSPDFFARILIGLEGSALSRADIRRLAHPAVGGAILFARNFQSATQLRRLCANIRRAASRPVVVAADQEGGRVQRFGAPDFTKLPPARDIPSDSAARDCGLVMAAEVVAAGLDISFAPVADLDRGDSAVVGNRAFAADPETAAARALAFADGMRAAGMQPCAKHFPGHGAVAADSHAETPADKRPLAAVRKSDIIPFRLWAKNNMPAVMTAHIMFPNSHPPHPPDSQRSDSSDAEHSDANLPATFSPFWLKTILRGELNFRGVIVGDDLAMAGADIGGVGTRLRAALSAGCDAVMVCEPAMVDEALSETERESVPESQCESGTGSESVPEPSRESGTGSDSPWLRLAVRPDGRATVGDESYELARERIESQWR